MDRNILPPLWQRFRPVSCKSTHRSILSPLGRMKACTPCECVCVCTVPVNEQEETNPCGRFPPANPVLLLFSGCRCCCCCHILSSPCWLCCFTARKFGADRSALMHGSLGIAAITSGYQLLVLPLPYRSAANRIHFAAPSTPGPGDGE